MDGQKTFFRTVNVKLTDRELIALIERGRSLDREIASVKDSMKTLKDERKRVSELLDDGYEARSLECIVTYDFPTWGNKMIRRRDTFAEVAVEPMTDVDRQAVITWEQPSKTEQADDDPSSIK